MCSGKAAGNRKDKDRNFQAELTFTLWNKLTKNNERPHGTTELSSAILNPRVGFSMGTR